VIEPFRLIHTRRGWEIDAGPVTPDGTLGTFLVDRVNSYTVLDAMFELPGNLEQLLVQQGTPVPVELVVPHETRWAVEKHADRVDVLAEDETSARLRGWLYQPVRHRVGLILTDGGPAATVVPRPTSPTPDENSPALCCRTTRTPPRSGVCVRPCHLSTRVRQNGSRWVSRADRTYLSNLRCQGVTGEVLPAQHVGVRFGFGQPVRRSRTDAAATISWPRSADRS